MTPTTPCAAVGQEDIYGIGIRLGLYLQWYSTCLAYLYQPQEARSFIVINYSFSTAVAIAGLVYRQAIHSHEIMILAILLMLPLTVIVAAMLNRTLRWLGSIQQHDPKKTPKPYNLTRKLLDIASLVLTTFLLFMAAWELFIEVNKAAIVPSCQPMFIWSYYISGLYPGFVKSVCVAFTLFAPAPIVYIMFSKLHMKSDEPVCKRLSSSLFCPSST